MYKTNLKIRQLFSRNKFWAAIALSFVVVLISLNTSKLSSSNSFVTTLLNKTSLKTPDASLTFNKRSALKDPNNRISITFKVPPKLKKRVRFWFDIYTKYDSDNYILHHVDYPWIVYDVYNTKDFFKTKRSRIRNRINARKAIYNKKRQVKNAFLRLSRKKSFKRLSRLERKLYNKLKYFKGRKQNVFKKAAYALRFQIGQKNFIQSGIKYSQNYLPYMEQIFKNHNLPTELTRIPFVESSFNIKAYSKVGASGIWQIMPSMGRRKLKINKLLDERNSPLKATKYAAQHLKQDYLLLRNWPFAVTAYNHGAGGLRKASRKLKTNSLAKIISNYSSRSFRFASKNFYTSFLAALHAEKYHEEIYGIQKNDPVFFETLRLNKKITTRNFLKLVGLAKNKFLVLNYDLKTLIKKNYYLPRNTDIFVPKGAKRLLKARLSKTRT